jgi:hypothetical protein
MRGARTRCRRRHEVHVHAPSSAPHRRRPSGRHDRRPTRPGPIRDPAALAIAAIVLVAGGSAVSADSPAAPTDPTPIETGASIGTSDGPATTPIPFAAVPIVPEPGRPLPVDP